MTYRIGIDIGGTFTDFALLGAGDQALAIHKLLTTPDDPSVAVIEGIDTLLAREGVDVATVAEIVHGTTLVTNAVIERRGARTGLVTTAGFRDILDMREEKRYDVFDLRLTFPEPIVARSHRVEVRERCHYDGSVEIPLDPDEALTALRSLVGDHAIDALAICLLHSYANPAHEQTIAAIAKEHFPGLYVATSSEVFSGRREFERFSTTCINAYTQPMFDRYLERLEASLATLGFQGRLHVMSSSGGSLAPAVARRLPVRVIESGPAAGVQMSVWHGRNLALDNLLSFDMGGTTAKGALVRDGAALKEYRHEVARQHAFKAGSGLPVRAPVVDLIEIGAGGGSIARIDGRGTIGVGPRSAGANPGPACYGLGGVDATLTDANLVLGYLDPGFFLGGEMRLDRDAARGAIAESVARPLALSTERAAWGVHEVICEDVARAFRIHASERGFDCRRASMVAFGGSGPLHALRVARKLRIPRVIFPVAAGVMSALGLLASPLSFEVARTRERLVAGLDANELRQVLAALEAEARAPLVAAGLAEDQVTIVRALDMRYHGQGHEIAVALPEGSGTEDLPRLFRARYEALYQFTYLDSPLVITTWKVEARGPDPGLRAGYTLDRTDRASVDPSAARKGERQALFAGAPEPVPTPVYDRYRLAPGAVVDGPALIEENESTAVIGPDDRVVVDPHRNLVAELGEEERT